MRGRWVGTVVGLAIGALVGWLWGRSIAQSIRGSGGPLGPDFPSTVGLIGLGVGVIVVVLIAGVLAFSPRRRELATTLFAIAVGLAGGYFIGISQV